LKKGKISMSDYCRMEGSLRRSKEFQPSKSYSSLLELPYATAATSCGIGDDEAISSGFPAPKEEERYLEELDALMDGSATSRSAGVMAGAAVDRLSEKDRETALKNPVSVYNWLRKHQPQVFLQDNEPQAEKASARSATSRASKRGSTVKQEPELYDEDGIAIDVTAGSRGKRKRDDDGGYRPKGGSGRPSKRKKEEGSGSAKKSKRPSTNTASDRTEA
jgi:hypothetical protein